MITFARGLVLRKNERTLEFERDLGGGVVQFKFLDNFEVQSFSLSKIYKEILAGTIKVVTSILAPKALSDDDESVSLPRNLGPKMDAQIAFKMHYIKAAQRSRATYGSATSCDEVVRKTSRPVAVDEAEEVQFKNFKTPKAPTLMKWLKRYVMSGCSPFALLDRRAMAHRPKRLSSVAEMIMEDCIAKFYLQLRGCSAKETHRQIKLALETGKRMTGEEYNLPSERTVDRRIAEIPPFIRDAKRFGLAYARNKWRFSLAGDQSTRTLERAEIDHTMLDIWVLDPRTGVPLGRPWISVVIDRMSGYILGIYVSFYGPSSATVANVLKCSILPKDEIITSLPEITVPWTAMGAAEMYVVDNGLEFHARTFRRIAWELRADLIYNPVRQPWLKASVERAMMEFNRMLPMQGKVVVPIKNSLPPNPQKSAAILFDDLCACLVMWAAEKFPYNIHPKTLTRPIDLWEEGRLWSPPAMFPTSLAQLDLATGISAERTIDGDGVFFQYMRFNSYPLQDYLRSHGEKFRTEIRFNPDSLSHVHVLLPKSNEWLPVEIQRPSPEYGNGLSLLQHQIIRAEAGKKLTRANAEEVLFQAQLRVCERWGEAIAQGVKVRRDSDLIRMQGYTSAQLTKAKADTPSDQLRLPEVSAVTQKLLPEVIPYETFSLAEEEF